MPRPLTLLALFFAGCVTKEDELASLDRDGDGFYHPAAEALGEAGPFDCDDADDSVQDAATFFRDGDGDGFGDEADALTDCAAPSGYVATSGDCDDAAFDVKPGATEVCNGADDDCDADIDDGLPGATYYPDGDEDGFGDEALGEEACEAPDGWITEGGDCDDADDAVHPDAEEQCNLEDDDCDGTPDDGLSSDLWYHDSDGDGYGAPDTFLEACASPGAEYTLVSGDCDDGDDVINPLAIETCDGTDEDCDGSVDDGFAVVTWYEDSDDDGYGSPWATETACVQPSGFVAASGDCDDASDTINPGAVEVCNDGDDDCDGVADDGIAVRTWYEDVDGDGYGVTSTTESDCEAPAGYASASGDCDDADAKYHPGATESCGDVEDYNCDGSTGSEDADGDGSPACLDCDDTKAEALPGGSEICDGLDNDCNGTTDGSDAADAATWYADSDGDGYGTASSVEACDMPVGYASTSGDCDDASSADRPGASEITANGDDDDCDGKETCWADVDADGAGASSTMTSSDADCSDSGEATASGDCDDTSASIKPGATETCNSKDDDCDGGTDEGVTSSFFADADGDGYGVSSVTTTACTRPSGYATLSTDCDDASATDYPGATEVTGNEDDESCDGTEVCWYDADGDKYGGSITAASADTDCRDSAEATASGDCDDTSSSDYPGAVETCDGDDDDCDGTADDGVLPTWYADADGDGYGLASATTTACSKPTGYVSVSGDCDDTSSSDYPGAAETCDGDDDDCDGTADDGVKLTYYRDADSDGYGTTATTTSACSAPSGYVTTSTDCDDASASDYPGATETIANGDDEDCSGGDSCYTDADADLYGSTAALVSSDLDCTDSGESSLSTDCDDTSSTVKPGGTETCNSKDDDCDGSTDEGVTTTYYRDADSDTYGVSTTTTTACSLPSGYATRSTDCDDTSASDYPGASESVANGDDEDCDGVDSCYDDNDSDGYGGTTIVDSLDLDCTDAGESSLSTDCSDSNAARSPGALEVCDDTIDDDCSGTADTCRLTGEFSSHSDYDAFFSGEGADDKAGTVSAAGDIDADGIGDILIGAIDATAGDGKVYLFYGPFSGSSSVSGADVIFTASGTDDSLGKSLSPAGDFDGDGVNDILFGASTYDTSTSATNAGAAYVVLGPPTSGSASTADLILTGPTASDTAGTSVAGLGDIDGDGKDDIIVGSPGDDDAASGAGAAFVWLGESVTTPATKSLSGADAKIRGIAAGDGAGASVAGPGDINGDGDPDVLVGAKLWDSSGTVTQVGAVYLFLSPVSGTLSASSDADVTIKGAAAGDRFGEGLSGGDVNADGYADICAGALGYGSTDTGAGLLFYGPLTGTSTYTSVVDATFTGEAAGDFTGGDVACDGDVNGDGEMDVAIGAMANATYVTAAGAVYVFHSAPTGTMSVSTADTIIRGGVAGSSVGISLALVPDAEGTGYAAVFVGSDNEGFAGILAGGSWLFFGGP